MQGDVRSVTAYVLAYVATRQWNRLGLGPSLEETFELDDDVALLDAPTSELIDGAAKLAGSPATFARAEALLHAAGRDPGSLPDWAAPMAARWDEVHRAVEATLGDSTVEFLVEVGLWRPAAGGQGPPGGTGKSPT